MNSRALNPGLKIFAISADMSIEERSMDFSPIVNQAWNRCECGQIKPLGTNCCWRCIERDPVFTRLDRLIAAGFGSIPQTAIPREVFEQYVPPGQRKDADSKAA